MVAFAFKNIYFHLFYQVHGMSGNADTPNLRQFPLIPLLLSSFSFNASCRPIAFSRKGM